MQNANQKILRNTLRKQRLTLTPRQRKLASHQAYRHLVKLPIPLINSRKKPVKIGIYLDAFGELPIQPILDWAKRHHFELYLPSVVGDKKPLRFIKMPHAQPKSWRLINHSLGMRQPVNLRQAVETYQLDMIFMPLVAVDKFGYRMGMGGGFYDRTLAKCKNKPIKIGWAYDFQMVEKLAVNPWDVKLDFAIFPSGLKKFSRYLTDTPTMPTIEEDNLSNELISQVMSTARLEDLLNRAHAFTLVNSEDLDSF